MVNHCLFNCTHDWGLWSNQGFNLLMDYNLGGLLWGGRALAGKGLVRRSCWGPCLWRHLGPLLLLSVLPPRQEQLQSATVLPQWLIFCLTQPHSNWLRWPWTEPLRLWAKMNHCSPELIFLAVCHMMKGKSTQISNGNFLKKKGGYFQWRKSILQGCKEFLSKDVIPI